MKKKVLLSILLLLAGGIALYLVMSTMYMLIKSGFKGTWNIPLDKLLSDGILWALWIILIICFIFFAFLNYRLHWAKRVLKVNYLENSHWLTKYEIKKAPNLSKTSFKKIPNEEDGIPIFAQKKARSNNIDILLNHPTHTLVIGTTGSGKTSAFVDPSIQILTRCKTKPSLVITDPKGELCQRHAKDLKIRGYDVKILDFKDIYHSVRWNPFSEILRKTEQLKNLKIEQRKGKYYLLERKFLTHESAEREIKSIEQQLTNEVYEDLQDLIYTICPIENTKDSTWQKGARDLIFGLALGFWEDVRDGFMKPKQFNLYNLYQNISMYLTEDMTEFKQFFDERSKFSRTRALAKTVLISQDRTLTSYLGDVNQYLSWMADTGISNLTAENEIDLLHFDEKPSALFVRIPDEKVNRHKLVTLFITQMYKALVSKANQNFNKKLTKEEELLRNVYFVMEEFGNLPKFHAIDKIITVGRSRKIWMLPIIQDYAQLDNIYSKEIAHIIKSNCPTKLFIGSTDKDTINEISQLCGKSKVKSVSYTDRSDFSISTQAQDKPLIYPSELQTLNDPPHRMGNAIVLFLGKPPLKAKFTPFFQAKNIYNAHAGELEKREPQVFNDEDYFYDIIKRHEFIQKYSELENEQDEADNTVIKPAIKETKKIDNDSVHESKLYALRGKIDDDKLTLLLSSTSQTQLNILDSLADEAMTARNKFLLFELATLKSQIEEGEKEYVK